MEIVFDSSSDSLDVPSTSQQTVRNVRHYHSWFQFFHRFMQNINTHSDIQSMRRHAWLLFLATFIITIGLDMLLIHASGSLKGIRGITIVIMVFNIILCVILFYNITSSDAITIARYNQTWKAGCTMFGGAVLGILSYYIYVTAFCLHTMLYIGLFIIAYIIVFYNHSADDIDTRDTVERLITNLAWIQQELISKIGKWNNKLSNIYSSDNIINLGSIHNNTSNDDDDDDDSKLDRVLYEHLFNIEYARALYKYHLEHVSTSNQFELRIKEMIAEYCDCLRQMVVNISDINANIQCKHTKNSCYSQSLINYIELQIVTHKYNWWQDHKLFGKRDDEHVASDVLNNYSYNSKSLQNDNGRPKLKTSWKSAAFIIGFEIVIYYVGFIIHYLDDISEFEGIFILYLFWLFICVPVVFKIMLECVLVIFFINEYHITHNDDIKQELSQFYWINDIIYQQYEICCSNCKYFDGRQEKKKMAKVILDKMVNVKKYIVWRVNAVKLLRKYVYGNVLTTQEANIVDIGWMVDIINQYCQIQL